MDLLRQTLSGELGPVTQDDLKDALIHATLAGSREIVGELLRQGSDPDCADMDGQSLLMMAVPNDHKGKGGSITEGKCLLFTS